MTRISVHRPVDFHSGARGLFVMNIEQRKNVKIIEVSGEVVKSYEHYLRHCLL
jgi:hypothetical protein